MHYRGREYYRTLDRWVRTAGGTTGRSLAQLGSQCITVLPSFRYPHLYLKINNLFLIPKIIPLSFIQYRFDISKPPKFIFPNQAPQGGPLPVFPNTLTCNPWSEMFKRTNQKNKSLISDDRNNKATLRLTILRSTKVVCIRFILSNISIAIRRLLR